MNVLARNLVQKTLFSISLAVALRKYRHFISGVNNLQKPSFLEVPLLTQKLSSMLLM